MIASLGMYDRPETIAANDALWAGIRENLGFGPQELDRTTAFMDIWQSPDLLFSQTCGMPYRIKLHGSVQLVGTPDYGIHGAPAGYYHSVIVVRKDDSDELADYQHRIFAYNDAISQSGWAAPQTHVREIGFQFENLHRSGGHVLSATAVATGQADIAALDAVGWRMMCAYDDFAQDLKVVGKTTATPGLPFITSLSQDADVVFSAVQSAIGNLSENHRQTLGITGIIRIASDDYLAVPTPPAPRTPA